MNKRIFRFGIWAIGLVSSVAAANEYVYQEDCRAFSDNSYCIVDFQDFYIGGNLGGITLASYFSIGRQAPFYDLVEKDFLTNGFTIGLRSGYDWNCSYGLFGFVVDWNRSSIDHRYTSFLHAETIKLKLDWYLTIRGRFGFTACNTLFYLTAGAAVAHLDTKWDTLETIATRWGWTGGVGSEYRLGKHWSLGADILYMHFANKLKTFEKGTRIFHSSEYVLVGRGILNYHFGNPFDYCFKKKR